MLRDLSLSSVCAAQFENSMGLLENQNKDLANKLQQQKVSCARGMNCLSAELLVGGATTTTTR